MRFTSAATSSILEAGACAMYDEWIVGHFSFYSLLTIFYMCHISAFRSTCTAINSWAKSKGAPYVNASGSIDYDIVRIHFEIEVSKLAAKLDKRAVFWQEAWVGGLGANSSMPLGAFDKSAIFTSWSGNDCSMVYQGYDVLLNTGWYLDQTTPGGPQPYAWQDYWSNFWGKEPCACGT